MSTVETNPMLGRFEAILSDYRLKPELFTMGNEAIVFGSAIIRTISNIIFPIGDLDCMTSAKGYVALEGALLAAGYQLLPNNIKLRPGQARCEYQFIVGDFALRKFQLIIPDGVRKIDCIITNDLNQPFQTSIDNLLTGIDLSICRGFYCDKLYHNHVEDILDHKMYYLLPRTPTMTQLGRSTKYYKHGFEPQGVLRALNHIKYVKL
ncbi:MAG: hypothetical protein KAS12_04660 [Candidatus Aenigmarchaeota archaeon]|nr:hypothetical protein [Candidatus Aenigmarchaeota archaeon]